MPTYLTSSLQCWGLFSGGRKGTGEYREPRKLPFQEARLCIYCYSRNSSSSTLANSLLIFLIFPRLYSHCWHFISALEIHWFSSHVMLHFTCDSIIKMKHPLPFLTWVKLLKHYLGTLFQSYHCWPLNSEGLLFLPITWLRAIAAKSWRLFLYALMWPRRSLFFFFQNIVALSASHPCHQSRLFVSGKGLGL